LELPIKAPHKALVKEDISAHQRLEHCKMLKENYSEHNPSATISVGDGEWLSVGNWVYENWDMVGGLSFLPRNDFVYRLAPYEEISEERFQQLALQFPAIDFSQLVLYENQDQTTGAKELACVSGVCEIDIPAESPKK